MEFILTLIEGLSVSSTGFVAIAFFPLLGARKIKNSLGGEQESVDQAPKLKGTRVLARELKKGPRWVAGEYSTHLAA